MIKNYFRTGLRSLWKNKATAFINLFGLSTGMTAAVFIFLWVQNEISFDNYHPSKSNIYRITNSIQVNKDEAWVWESSPMLMGETAIKEIPEVEKSARILINEWSSPVITVNNKLFSEKTSAYVDNSWFNIFHYDFVAGNPAAFSRDPFSVILTESKVKKYFGDANPVGQLIRVDTINYTVQAVIKDNPINSSFQFDVLMQMGAYLSNPETLKNDKSWGNFGYITFLQLRNDARKDAVETKLNEIITKRRNENNDQIRLTRLSDMYFENDLQSSSMAHGSRKTAYAFGLLGILLLITACINYVNLTTAKASLRAKEISVRKIIGAQRKHVFLQLIAESILMSFLAMVITVIAIQSLLPVFNSITERQFDVPLSSFMMWKVLIGTFLFSTILNGLYPAALLSSFKPLNVFRGKSVLNLNDGAVRKGLVIFQYTLSMALITGTIVIYQQLHYMQTKNPGYNVAQIISVYVPDKAYSHLKGDAAKAFFSSFKQELQSQSSIQEVSIGSAEIVNIQSRSSGNADWDGRDSTYNPTIASMTVNSEFKKMFQLQVKDGRWFRPGNQDIHNYILNETAAKEFNIHKPVIGQRFTWGGKAGQVIGIVNDFHYNSMHDKIGPMVLFNNEDDNSFFFIKASPGNVSKALHSVASIWSKFIPSEPFAYTFLDDSFDTLYKTDIKTSQLIFIFSVIAIVISALGLFGLAAFTAEQRTKEIGIRKVLGASIQQITSLLSKDFVILVTIAIVIASPVAWWAMDKWLQDFAYHVNITPWTFIAGGLISMVIAVIAVSVQTIKAAMANPVKSLRTE